jgi:hypothetical protein
MYVKRPIEVMLVNSKRAKLELKKRIYVKLKPNQFLLSRHRQIQLDSFSLLLLSKKKKKKTLVKKRKKNKNKRKIMYGESLDRAEITVEGIKRAITMQIGFSYIVLIQIKSTCIIHFL